MAARAYIEQFADETFQRGVNAMKANRATRYLYTAGCHANQD